jgi:hypothetical protein
VGEQSVVTHADAQASGNPIEKDAQQEGFPTEKEECDDRSHVEGEHGYRRDPIDLILARRILP